MSKFVVMRRSISIIVGSRNYWTSGKFLSKQHESSTETNNNQEYKTDQKCKTDDDKQNDNDYETDLQSKILGASLQFVPELGWTQQAISAGAEFIGYPGIIHGIFSEGGAELVHYFNTVCNDELVKILKEKMSSKQEAEFVKSRTLDPKVYDALETRIKMVFPYKKTWPQALGLMSLPQNIPIALNNFTRMIDDVCYYTGDRSVNIDWYTKRLAVATIYKSTEFYMLQDSSKDNRETLEFLKRRVEDVSSFGQTFSSVSNRGPSDQIVDETLNMAKASFITIRNMLGFNWR